MNSVHNVRLIQRNIMKVTCDPALFFSGERESVAARELTLALPHFRAPPKKRTPDRGLLRRWPF